MSHQAVTWALHQAPMLRTDAGKPDSTSRLVLVALAQHADHDGYNAFPSVFQLTYVTGLAEKSVRRALGRLEDSGLISRNGTVGNGVTAWCLDLSYERSTSDRAAMEAVREAELENERARWERRKVKRSGTQSSGVDSDGVSLRDSEFGAPGFCVPTPGRKVHDSGTQSPGLRDGESPIRVPYQSVNSHGLVNETASASDAGAFEVIEASPLTLVAAS